MGSHTTQSDTPPCLRAASAVEWSMSSGRMDASAEPMDTRFPSQSSVLDESALQDRVVGEYPIRSVRSCHFLSRGDADIYRVISAGANYYLKVYRPPKKRTHVESEAVFVARLAEAGLPVVRAVRRRDGAFASLALASEGLRPILMFEEAPPPLPRELSTKRMEALGRTIARVHGLADSDPTPYDLPSFDLKTVETERVPHIRRFATEEDRIFMETVVEWIRPQLSEIQRASPEWGICHSDLVLSNVRDGEGGVYLFDFGSIARTYREFELGVVFWSLGHRYLNQREELWGALLNGYEAVRSLPSGLAARLPMLLSLRELAFLGGNAATLPLRLGTEPFESTFIHDGFVRIRSILSEVDEPPL